MARPREFDRATALHDAMNLFWQRGGYDRTSVSQLTAAMGISSPSLYGTFGGKRELFDEAVTQYAQRPNAPVAQAISAPTAREVVARMLEGAVAEYTDPDHPLGCLINADPSLGDRRDEGRALIADRLDRAARDGDLPADVDPDALAEFLVVLLNGLAGRARDGVPRERLLAVTDIARRAVTGAAPA
ncbi:TetR/AcrR family transcriptional regulator [Mycolicibacterium sediminis]|uniref:TetR family transcriptional regulator n=1 Tax=Mycolicibacterium sediminis TaxID=1286180 RepID=A0A7I7QRY0_9MYCO|nr:TetR/AcrR family transcriptional regulator [Mycolicibacterium sediminis]BBY28717.1 TetR family transcriptional regulator [Mycolicibacterium sediminis]